MKQLSLMIKPASSLCNMRCRYCFYEDVSSLRDQASFGIMTAKTRKAILTHTFSRILAAKKGLERSQVPYNVVMVLTNTMARHPRQIWNFLKKESIAYAQFIPCLAPLDCEAAAPYALTPVRYAGFYTDLFDLWHPETIKGHFQSIKLFDDLLNLLVRGEETACGITGACHGQLIVESDGSVYPCDFYALDSWRLGNLSQAPLKEIYESPQMSAFRSRPKDLPTACASCPYTRICGGCPRMRREVFCSPKNKFCGYRTLLDAILPRLQLLARSLKP